MSDELTTPARWKYPAGFWPRICADPDLFRTFLALALKARASGARRWSADAILHVMRWERLMRGGDSSPYRLNNNYTAALARLAMLTDSRLEGFFELRKTRLGATKVHDDEPG